MTTDPINDLLTDIEAKSLLYGVGATGLSNRLEEIDGRLSNLPGKIEINFETEGEYLKFCRIDGDTWGLSYFSHQRKEWSSITDLSVREKIAASELVQPLLNELRAQLSHANEVIQRIERLSQEEN